MTVSEAFADQPFAPGERESGSIDVADPVASAVVSVDGGALAALPPSDVLSAMLVVSLDGTTWIEWCGATVAGGTKRDKAGAVDNESTFGRTLPAGTRKVRVRVTAKRALRMSCAVGIAPAAASPEPPVHNSVTYDNSATAKGKNVSSLTCAGFVLGNNADRLLVAAAHLDDGTAGQSVSSIAWNTSESLSSWQTGSHGTQTARLEVWKLVAPTATTASAVCTFAASTYNVGFHILSVYNAHQSTFNTPSANTGGTSPATGTSTGETDGLAYAAAYAGNNDFSTIVLENPPLGWDNRTIQQGGGDLDVSASSVSTQAGNGAGHSVSVAITSGSVADWVTICVCIKPVAAAAGGGGPVAKKAMHHRKLRAA